MKGERTGGGGFFPLATDFHICYNAVRLGERSAWNAPAEPDETMETKGDGRRMDDRKEKEGPRFTGWYAVVHFGKDGKDGVPCYLRKIPYRDCQGVEHTAYWHFTADLREAELFANTYDADLARAAVEKALAEKSHCLAGHVKVMEIRGVVREFGKEGDNNG